MVTPIILTVDDEPQVVNAVERDLRSHFRREYRIVKAFSGKEALAAVKEFKRRNDPIALFLVDQRMPAMTGVEFLAEAKRLYPEAKKVLLTAYADTEAAIRSINDVGLDYYLMKPWDPPEQNLYPVLDDLLSVWAAATPLPYEGIRVAGTQWSSASHNVKDFLARNRIPYQWLDVEKDEQARLLVEEVNQGQHRLPVIFLPDGDVLIEPDTRSLAEKVGLQTHANQPLYDIVIVGAGPAGLGAAVYGASEGLRTAMIESQATGGQAGTSSRIENYLGFPNGLSGSDLAQRATIQARRFGAEILTGLEAVKVRVEDPNRIVTLNDGSEVVSRALIIATGVTVSKLMVPGAEAITGAGVYYGAAMTEAAYYKGGHVFVVGGANSAGQGAIFLAQYASRVTMLVRGGSIAESMSHYLVDQIHKTPNIEVRTNIEVSAVGGQRKLETITLKNRLDGAESTAPASAVFVFIGASPHTDLVAGVVERNPAGLILTGPDLVKNGQRPKGWKPNRDPYLLETSVPGIFAAGDVRNGVVRRVASAVGEGAIAVSLVHQYLATV
ncbi:MAG: FAD-dependent oxidoreductase [Chloroflexi bacterium]|nr:FAD-dependent oxidoreductase [Chloroflexota bacterium]